MPTSCRTVKGHCRKLSAGKKAKPGRACQRNGSSGTLVKGHKSPKGCSGTHKFAHYSAGKIQAAFRKLSARRKSKPMAGKKRQFADTISSGHGKVKVGEEFETPAGVYRKTGSAKGKFVKVR
jgi:hypothetical protein